MHRSSKGRMELQEPKRKRTHPHIKIHQPFPILIESETGIQSHRTLWPLYTGSFNGDCVAICNPDEMTALYNMGFFGKGTFSRGYPSFDVTKKGVPPFIDGRQWNRRKKWIKVLENDLHNNPICSEEKQGIQDLNDKENNDNIGSYKGGNTLGSENEKPHCSNLISDNDVSTNKNTDNSVDFNETMDIHEESNKAKDLEIDEDHEMNKISKHNNILDGDSQIVESGYNSIVVVVNDSDGEEESILNNPKVTIENEPIKTVRETLSLSLEEAFFLSYALGCLQVFDWTEQLLSLIKMWCIFREVQPDFIENYVAYHYFRAKGWIVKPGYKFGGDLMLYKQGPPFYHASYVVVVDPVKDRRQSSGTLSWNKLHGINRVAETARKEVLVCQVFWPSQLNEEELDSPQVLPKFEVNEILLRRWISYQEREEKGNIYKRKCIIKE